MREAEFKRELLMSRRLVGLGWSVTSGAGWFLARHRGSGQLVRAQTLAALLRRVRGYRGPVQLALPLGLP